MLSMYWFLRNSHDWQLFIKNSYTKSYEDPADGLVADTRWLGPYRKGDWKQASDLWPARV